jgi:predicted DNA-binding transcriptional regulator YafY
MAPDIVRHLDPACLRQVLGAIRTRQALAIRYQSLTSSRWRRIAPHALVFDGYRWHARAFCCERRDFRDFVLTRIDETGDLHAVEFDVNDDLEWTTQVTLKLCPHPGLTSDQSEAVQRDFNMTRGCRDITVRASMAYYFIKRMNLDLLDLPADRAQIALQNLAEVQAAILAAKQASVELVARNAAEALQAGKDNS